jgi:hypothetical protein
MRLSLKKTMVFVKFISLWTFTCVYCLSFLMPLSIYVKIEMLNLIKRLSLFWALEHYFRTEKIKNKDYAMHAPSTIWLLISLVRPNPPQNCKHVSGSYKKPKTILHLLFSKISRDNVSLSNCSYFFMVGGATGDYPGRTWAGAAWPKVRISLTQSIYSISYNTLKKYFNSVV